MMFAVVLAQSSEPAAAWVVVAIAAIAAIGSMGSAYFSNRTRRENNDQHGRSVAALGEVRDEMRNLASEVREITRWRDMFAGSALPDAHAVNDLVQRLAHVETKLIAHVEWEKSDQGVYAELMKQVRELRTALERHITTTG